MIWVAMFLISALSTWMVVLHLMINTRDEHITRILEHHNDTLKAHNQIISILGKPIDAEPIDPDALGFGDN